MADDIQNIDTDIFEKVDEMLADTGKIPTQTAFRLTLQLQKQTAEAVNRLVHHVNVQNSRISKLETQTSDLINKNIVKWVVNNPKMAVFYFFIFTLFIDVVVDQVSSADSLQMLSALVKKFLGL